MITPYDWQEGMGHRTSFVQERLSAGTPVLMVSLPEGILAYAVRRQARKIYEIYDKLLMGAIGQQSDVESLRVSAIDFTHQEGFNRSEEDVTIARVASALSAPLKRAFGDFNTAPFIVQALFAEVGETVEDDLFYILDFDGDFSVHKTRGYLVGDPETSAMIYDGLTELSTSGSSVEEARKAMRDLWIRSMNNGEMVDPEKALLNLTEEVMLLRRKVKSEIRTVTL